MKPGTLIGGLFLAAALAGDAVPWPAHAPDHGDTGVQVVGTIVRAGRVEVSAWRIRLPGEDWRARLPADFVIDETSGEILANEPAAPTLSLPP